jgi:hypothetical protein
MPGLDDDTVKTGWITDDVSATHPAPQQMGRDDRLGRVTESVCQRLAHLEIQRLIAVRAVYHRRLTDSGLSNLAAWGGQTNATS